MTLILLSVKLSLDSAPASSKSQSININRTSDGLTVTCSQSNVNTESVKVVSEVSILVRVIAGHFCSQLAFCKLALGKLKNIQTMKSRYILETLVFIC